MNDHGGLTGAVTIEVRTASGELVQWVHTGNVITDVGDQYYATRSVAGVMPANRADVARVTGTKLGTGTMTADKSGAGAALAAYLPGSNKAFDAGYPTVTSAGAGLGYQVEYRVSYPSGILASTAITEAVICTDSTQNATSQGSATIARVTFPAVNKSVADSLTLSWTHTLAGSL